mmetsp:Transcript_23007/g.47063  ORF Transcript_23007/g.47063 Transcript_23007/m.47063 type:complete len:215 (-) Transcript_23007:185-829(-)
MHLGTLRSFVLSLLFEKTWATTLVAAHYNGGLIIGADSRTSRGGFISNKAADKLTIISPSLVLARSGSAADTQALAEDLLLEIRRLVDIGHECIPLVKVAAHIVSRSCFEGKDTLSASLLCAGWDEHTGLQIYSIPRGGSLIRCPKFALSGSGGGLIRGFCDHTWRDGMTRNECAAFVSQAIQLAIDRDASSGGGLQLLFIEPGERGFQRICPT